MAVKAAKNSGRRGPGRPFQPGKGAQRDPRINTKGRPPSKFAELEAEAQEVLEQVPIYVEVVDPATGRKRKVRMTRRRALLLAMSSSRDARDRKAILQIAYGTRPVHVDLTSGDEPIEGLAQVVFYIPDNGRNDTGGAAPAPPSDLSRKSR